MKLQIVLLAMLALGCDRDNEPAAQADPPAPQSKVVAAPTTQQNATQIWVLKTKIASLKQYLDNIRLTGTTEEKLAASKIYNDARAELAAIDPDSPMPRPQPPAESKPVITAAQSSPPIETQSDERAVEHSGPAASSGPGSQGSEKTVHVNGYTRKDGTHVDSYNRAPPGGGRGRR